MWSRQRFFGFGPGGKQHAQLHLHSGKIVPRLSVTLAARSVCFCFGAWGDKSLFKPISSRLQNSTSNKYHLSGIALLANLSDAAGMSCVRSNILYDSSSIRLIQLLPIRLSPQLHSQPATRVWTTCAVRWAAPTCATQSKLWLSWQPSLSTHSDCRSNPLKSPPISLLQVKKKSLL